MTFEDDIIECIIERERIDKDIFLYDVRFYFFDISRDDKKSNYQNDHSEHASKYPMRITKKSKTTDNTSSEINYQEKHNSKTYKIGKKSYESHGEARWEYGCKKHGIGRITA